jgi:hypothetical protein
MMLGSSFGTSLDGCWVQLETEVTHLSSHVELAAWAAIYGIDKKDLAGYSYNLLCTLVQCMHWLNSIPVTLHLLTILIVH